MVRPSVLCPVDFSEASRGALRYAAALAEHFYAGLTVMTADDPFLADAAEVSFGQSWLVAQSQQGLEEFVRTTLTPHQPALPEIRLDVAVGKPAIEILRLALERRADAIVMSSHGTTGARKLLFGSTTERVLRETRVPVLVTAAADPGPSSLEELRQALRSILLPVDFTAATDAQVRVGRGVAAAFGTSITLLHVMEPLPGRLGHERLLVQAETVRREFALHALKDLAADIAPTLHVDTVLATGVAADEIVRVSRERGVGGIVMGLHGSPMGGPRMGSVTYRVLCHTPALILALPPQVSADQSRRINLATTHQT
jgi:universal stress protein A